MVVLTASTCAAEAGAAEATAAALAAASAAAGVAELGLAVDSTTVVEVVVAVVVVAAVVIVAAMVPTEAQGQPEGAAALVWVWFLLWCCGAPASRDLFLLVLNAVRENNLDVSSAPLFLPPLAPLTTAAR